MSIYYTYYIFNTITNQHYYGARWAEGCTPDDLWVSYFTSSKKVKALIEQHGADSFIVQIRKTFTCKTKCREWERKVLTRLKIKSRSDWINEGVCAAPPRPKGYKHSPETLAKMKKPKGSWSEERRLAKSLDEKNKIANGKQMPSSKGYKHSPETLAKMKQRTPWNKGKKGVQSAWNKGLKKNTSQDPKITKSNASGSDA